MLADRQYPFAGLSRAWATLAAGSDWPVSSESPLAGIHVAVTRSGYDRDEGAEPFLPDQALSLIEIWDAYTHGSAFASFREGQTGSIAVGQAADLMLLDRDPFVGAPEEIASVGVRSTWIDGSPVFEAPERSGPV